MDGRDPGHGERAHVQPQRVRGRSRQGPAEEPRGAGHLRARLHVQGRDRVGGARGEAGDADRHRSTSARARSRIGSRRDQRHAPLRPAVVRGRDRQVEQRRRDQGRDSGSAPSGWAATCAGSGSAACCRPTSAARSPGIVWSAAERQRAGVGVDGLPDRRHAAADGHGRQLGRQRRAADGAAPGARDRPGRHAHARPAEGAARDDQPRDRVRADDDHGRRRRARHREGVEDRRLHDCREDRDRREARRRRLLEVRLHGVVRRVPAVAQAGRHDPRGHRLAARQGLHRRRCRRADLQAHRGSRHPAPRRAAVAQSRSRRCSCAARRCGAGALDSRATRRRDVVPAVLPATRTPCPTCAG